MPNLQQQSYEAGMHWNSKCKVFSVTRRSRGDESHSLTYSLTESLSVGIDLTDATLVSDDTYRRLNWCDPDYADGQDDPDESYLVMKVT